MKLDSDSEIITKVDTIKITGEQFIHTFHVDSIITKDTTRRVREIINNDRVRIEFLRLPKDTIEIRTYVKDTTIAHASETIKVVREERNFWDHVWKNVGIGFMMAVVLYLVVLTFKKYF